MSNLRKAKRARTWRARPGCIDTLPMSVRSIGTLRLSLEILMTLLLRIWDLSNSYSIGFYFIARAFARICVAFEGWEMTKANTSSPPTSVD
jgi:hypothetical protein